MTIDLEAERAKSLETLDLLMAGLLQLAEGGDKRVAPLMRRVGNARARLQDYACIQRPERSS
jgi:hypothetical protein